MADPLVPAVGSSQHQVNFTVRDKKEVNPRSFGRSTLAVNPDSSQQQAENGVSAGPSQNKVSVLDPHYAVNIRTAEGEHHVHNTSVVLSPKVKESLEVMKVREVRLFATLTNRAIGLNQRIIKEYQQGSWKKVFLFSIPVFNDVI